MWPVRYTGPNPRSSVFGGALGQPIGSASSYYHRTRPHTLAPGSWILTPDLGHDVGVTALYPRWGYALLSFWGCPRNSVLLCEPVSSYASWGDIEGI
jgi:hypothetical protein